MGGDIFGKIEGSTKSPRIETAGTGAADSTSTSTQTTGTGTRTGTGTGTGTEEEKLSGLSVLNEEEKKRQERNERRRQKYAEQKAENGQTVKPRKVNKKKNSSVSSVDTQSLKQIILTVSAVISERPKMKHWLLSDKEAESIATPISNMIAKSEKFSNMGEYADQIALVMACITIIIPRIYISIRLEKEVKKIERTGQHTDTVPKTEQPDKKGKASDSNRGNVRNAPSGGKDAVGISAEFGAVLA